MVTKLVWFTYIWKANVVHLCAVERSHQDSFIFSKQGADLDMTRLLEKDWGVHALTHTHRDRERVSVLGIARSALFKGFPWCVDAWPAAQLVVIAVKPNSECVFWHLLSGSNLPVLLLSLFFLEKTKREICTRAASDSRSLIVYACVRVLAGCLSNSHLLCFVFVFSSGGCVTSHTWHCSHACHLSGGLKLVTVTPAVIHRMDDWWMDAWM